MSSLTSRITLLVLLSLVVAGAPDALRAQVQTFTREYTYRAGEADSKLTARTNALAETRKALLAEIAIFIESRLERQVREDIRGISRSYDETMTSLIAGVVQERILEERWTGETYWVRVELQADPVQVQLDLGELVRARRAEAQQLLSNQRQADSALAEARRLRAEVDAERQRVAALEAALALARRSEVTQDSLRALAASLAAREAAMERGMALYTVQAEAVDAAALFVQGVQAFDAGRYTEGTALFQRACDAGNLRGCNGSAVSYEYGRGVPVDLARAKALHERTCEAGEGLACMNLGYLYVDGRGVAIDLPRSAEYFQRSCDLGEMQGCFVMGSSHFTGRGVALDRRRSAALFLRACTGGFAGGCSALADMYRDGDGVAADPARAAALKRRACELGRARDCGQE